MIRLLLAEDQTIVRQGLRRLLESQPDLHVVGEAENGQQAISFLERCPIAQVESTLPDLVLMDLRMPVMDGVTATHIICDRFPTIKVLVLTTFDEDESVAQAMQAGAIGYLLKDTPVDDLASAIRTAAKGYTQLAPGLFQKAIARPVAQPIPSNQSGLAALTPREREVLSLIATGASNREIAEILYITEKTVKNHVTNLLSRLHLRDRTQAAVFACSLLPTIKLPPIDDGCFNESQSTLT